MCLNGVVYCRRSCHCSVLLLVFQFISAAAAALETWYVCCICYEHILGCQTQRNGYCCCRCRCRWHCSKRRGYRRAVVGHGMSCHVSTNGLDRRAPAPRRFFFFSHVAPRLSLANFNAVSVFFSLTAQPAPALFQPVKAFRRWFSRQIRRAVV